jgi:hypothetical protein
MDSQSNRETRVLWSFWLACGLAATGGIAPLLLAAGGPNRIAGAVIPFAVAAIAMAANALTYHQGRPLATALYFVAGIALVYGMLSIIAVPLRLAVVGTCPPAPAICPAGFERPFTTGEGSGLAIGIAMGTLAILVGFFGLLMLFRIRPQISAPPPTRRDAVAVTAPPAPVETAAPMKETVEPEVLRPPEPEQPEPAPQPEPAAAVAAPTPKPARKPRAKRAPKPQAELAAPQAPLELAAPEEPLELPSSTSPDEPPGKRSSSS